MRCRPARRAAAPVRGTRRCGPGCAVRAAVEAGELPARRLASYHKLQHENAWAAARTDARLRAERTRRWKAVHAAQRARHRARGARGR